MKIPTYCKVTDNGQITIPKYMRHSMGIQKGDLIEIEICDGKAFLIPKQTICNKTEVPGSNPGWPTR
jgi:AbrB family looped-hinge helix DNA binding protein